MKMGRGEDAFSYQEQGYYGNLTDEGLTLGMISLSRGLYRFNSALKEQIPKEEIRAEEALTS
jgi:hypothetical protein